MERSTWNAVLVCFADHKTLGSPAGTMAVLHRDDAERITALCYGKGQEEGDVSELQAEFISSSGSRLYKSRSHRTAQVWGLQSAPAWSQARCFAGRSPVAEQPLSSHPEREHRNIHCCQTTLEQVQSRVRAVQPSSTLQPCAALQSADEEPPVQCKKTAPKCRFGGWFNSSQGAVQTSELKSCKTKWLNAEELHVGFQHRCSHRRASDGRAAQIRTMPFTEATLCGLATHFFPFSWYWGCRMSLWVPTVSSPVSSPYFWGDPRHAAVPHSPPAMHWDPQRAAPGPILLNSTLSKLPWLVLLETFTIPCLPGKDDCSKPKLGINYTTTLHFSYKGKLLPCPPALEGPPKEQSTERPGASPAPARGLQPPQAAKCIATANPRASKSCICVAAR